MFYAGKNQYLLNYTDFNLDDGSNRLGILIPNNLCMAHFIQVFYKTGKKAINHDWGSRIL